MIFSFVRLVGTVRDFLAPLAICSRVVLKIPTALNPDVLSAPGAHDAPAWPVAVIGMTTTKAPAVELLPLSPASAWLLDGVQVFKLATRRQAGVGACTSFEIADQFLIGIRGCR